MKRMIQIFALVVALIVVASPIAMAKDSVRTSGQPCLHGLPIWMALDEKWDTPVDFTFTLFPSGAPQVEAMAAGEWDCGAMGTVPTLMASLRYGAKLIAVSNEEGETNDLWVRPDSPLLKTKGANPKYPDIYGTKDDWKGKRILATTVSTGHFALSATLKALGLSDEDVDIVHIEQGQAITAFSSGEGDIVQLWAPFSYIAESKGWKKVSSGKRAGIMIPGGVVVRKEFAEEYPDLVVAWLDTYMAGLDKMRTEKAAAEKELDKYFTDYCGLKLPADALESEFTLRPLYTVDEQIDIMESPDKLPAWMKAISQFFVDQGRIEKSEQEEYLEANCYIDSSFMREVAKLRAARK